MLKAFFDYLATPLSLTKGTNFHLGQYPANQAGNGTAVLERVGHTNQPDTTDYRRYRFQFLTRNAKYVAGDTEANRIFDIVIQLRNVALTGYHLYDVSGTGPAYIGQDGKDRHMFSSNVTVSARKE